MQRTFSGGDRGMIREKEKNSTMSFIYWQYYFFIKRCVTLFALYVFVKYTETNNDFL